VNFCHLPLAVLKKRRGRFVHSAAQPRSSGDLAGWQHGVRASSAVAQ